MLLDSSLLGSTMEFRRIVSDGTLTEQPINKDTFLLIKIRTCRMICSKHVFYYYFFLPKIVIDGLSFPSLLNSGGFSILANGLLGSGSEGVPSTLAHLPTLEPFPIMLCNTKDLSSIVASARTILSLILTPGPTVTPGPILTLGPS